MKEKNSKRSNSSRKGSVEFDAVVVGSGPNGLAAGIFLLQAGCKVLLIEGKSYLGGGVHSEELTLPGFVHDICSTVHPLAVSSPFFSRLPLEKYGLQWVYPPVELVHPFDDNQVISVKRSIDETASQLLEDQAAYRSIFSRFIEKWEQLFSEFLKPLRVPLHPFLMADFGRYALQSLHGFALRYFEGEKTRTLLAGMASHSMLDLYKPISASFGLILGLSAHAVGWPLPIGGAQSITSALSRYYQSLGGEILLDKPVTSLGQLPESRAVLLDITPRQFLEIAGDQLPTWYFNQIRNFRYGPGVCKVDWALDGPIPWKSEDCLQAATVHIGGSFQEILKSEQEVYRGIFPEKPTVILVQSSLFDPTRTPKGKHTAWAYCHVPNGSMEDMQTRIEMQVERFAPGFRHRIMASHVYTAAQMESYNPNYVGGDINGGLQDIRQLVARPVLRWDPYSTPLKGVYLCSSSTPPGGGVHGMCGYWAARQALKRL
jgi:phytoene dehydrogenase-like protein